MYEKNGPHEWSSEEWFIWANGIERKMHAIMPTLELQLTTNYNTFISREEVGLFLMCGRPSSISFSFMLALDAISWDNEQAIAAHILSHIAPALAAYPPKKHTITRAALGEDGHD